MRSQTKEALQLFIDKAKRLLSTGYMDSIEALNINWEWVIGEGEKLYYSGPDENQIQAFVLTFRYFIQNNEHCSFMWLANNVLDDPGLSQDWKNEFVGIRQVLNDYLDEYPQIPTTTTAGSPPTRRVIMDVFVYGDLAHATQEKREIFRKWNSIRLIQLFFKTEFIKILGAACGAIIAVKNLSEKELSNN